MPFGLIVYTLTVLGEQVIGPANDEAVDEGDQGLQLLIAVGLLLLCRIRVPALQNGILVILAELEPRAQDSWIGKAEKGEVLGEVILNRRAGQQNTALDIDGIEGLVSPIRGVL